MAIRNNSFSQDTDAVRGERLDLMSSNIDTYAALIGVVGALLAWAQGAAAAWLSAFAAAIGESGESEDAYENLHNYLLQAAKFYATARTMLQNIIWDAGGKPDKFIESYGFEGRSPRDYFTLRGKIEVWLNLDAKLKALIPPDERVVPDPISVQLATYRDTLLTMFDTADDESTESENAYAAKHLLYDTDAYKLNIVLMSATLVMGDDDPRLHQLGFCPSSEIWTAHTPPSVKDLLYAAGLFSWTAIEGVDSYELQCRLVDETGDWTTFYEGADTSTTEKPAAPGTYNVRCRAIAGDDLGAWSGEIEVGRRYKRNGCGWK